jgi:hypothetical protein
MIPAHPLFGSSLGTLKIRSDAYYRIHAELTAHYRRVQASRKTKRQRHQAKSERFRRTAEI